jgi:hypothetical protein
MRKCLTNAWLAAKYQIKNEPQKNLCMLIRAKIWNQPRYSSMDEWIKKM